MKIKTYSRKNFNYYNDIQLRLSEEQESLNELIGLPFSIEAFKKQIQLKQNNFPKEKRKLLQSYFEVQYKNIDLSDAIKDNIKRVSEENTFTITTGQQLTLFGGPAFFFYKIIHCISLSIKLKEYYPEFNFIPVFWLASEDHDKEEIAETTIFNQKFYWENEFTGATGEFPLDDNIQEIKTSIIDFFSNNEDCDIISHLKKFSGVTLSEAFIHFLTSIFKDYGLLVLDANSTILKKELSFVLENEINNFSTFKHVSETNTRLLSQGIKPQAKIKEVNFFKLSKNQRLKINFSDEKFFIANKEISKDALLSEIQNNPESFSPNVFIRPLYQEIILPNLAYIGGPGELSYWIQLKSNFDFYKIPYPLLVNRQSIFIIDPSTMNKMKNLSFTLIDFINTSYDELKKNYLDKTQEYKNINWDESDSQLQIVLASLKDLYENSAPEICNFLESEWKNIEKSIDKVKNKLHKQVANKHELSIKQINQIKSKLFPNAIPQERFYHFFTYCPDGSLKLLHELIQEIDPFSTDILVISN